MDNNKEDLDFYIKMNEELLRENDDLKTVLEEMQSTIIGLDANVKLLKGLLVDILDRS